MRSDFPLSPYYWPKDSSYWKQIHHRQNILRVSLAIFFFFKTPKIHSFWIGFFFSFSQNFSWVFIDCGHSDSLWNVACRRSIELFPEDSVVGNTFARKTNRNVYTPYINSFCFEFYVQFLSLQLHFLLWDTLRCYLQAFSSSCFPVSFLISKWRKLNFVWSLDYSTCWWLFSDTSPPWGAFSQHHT